MLRPAVVILLRPLGYRGPVFQTAHPRGFQDLMQSLHKETDFQAVKGSSLLSAKREWHEMNAALGRSVLTGRFSETRVKSKRGNHILLARKGVFDLRRDGTLATILKFSLPALLERPCESLSEVPSWVRS
jgi:hypothetical protein